MSSQNSKNIYLPNREKHEIYVITLQKKISDRKTRNIHEVIIK